MYKLIDYTRRLNGVLIATSDGRWDLARVLVGMSILILGMLYGMILATGVSLVYALVPLIAAVGLWMVFAAPEYAALALCGLRWGFVFDAFDRSLKIQSPAVPLAILLLIIMLSLRFGPQKRKLVSDPIAWLIVFYLIYVCMGIWYADFTGPVQGRIGDFIKDVLICLVIMNFLVSPVLFERTIWLIVGVAALLATLTIYQEVTQTYDNSYWDLARVKIAFIVDGQADRPRAGGPLGDPNFYGQIPVLAFPFALWLIFNGKTWLGKLGGGYALLVLLGAIGLTYSRGTFLAFAVALLVYFIYFGFNPRYLLFMLPMAVAAYLAAPSDLKNRLSTLTELVPSNQTTTVSDTSFLGRSVEVAIALNMFLDNPILGVGADNYRPHYISYIREYGSAVEDKERNAHNFYLEIAAEHGVIGLSMVLSMIVLAFQYAHQARQSFLAAGNRRWADLSACFQISFIGYLITAIFLHGDYPRLFWIALALAVGLRQAGQQCLAEVKNTYEPR